MNVLRPISRERALVLEALHAGGGDVLLELCRSANEQLPRTGAELAMAIAEGAVLDSSAVMAASVRPDSLGIAVFNGAGRLTFANALFGQCLPNACCDAQ